VEDVREPSSPPYDGGEAAASADGVVLFMQSPKSAIEWAEGFSLPKLSSLPGPQRLRHDQGNYKGRHMEPNTHQARQKDG